MKHATPGTDKPKGTPSSPAKAPAMPLIAMKEHARRRRELMSLLDENSMAIVPSARVQSRNSDVDFPFRQDSDFTYLTGFHEPNAVLVLIPGREHGEVVLFCQDRDPEAERWHGAIIGTEGAVSDYGMDDSFPVSDIDDILPGLIEGREKLYYAMGSNKEFDQQVIGWVQALAGHPQAGSRPPGEFVHLGQYVHELRLFKSPQEVKVMRQAARATAVGHQRLLNALQPGVSEARLDAELNYGFALGGAPATAYPSIVGAGDNANVLHYTANNCQVAAGDLVLVDAGAEYEGYACDVTRTLPATGKFTPAQATIYELVLAAQLAAIECVQPGNHWNMPHEAAVRVLTEGLVDLGLLKGDPQTLIEKEAYKRFYMHRTGHWLGLDVHDVGDYQIEGEWRVFEPGMITTIEPALYIDADSKGVAKKYRGIGIRIEDDILVTRTGNDVLTRMIPKTIVDIEKQMAKAAAQG